MTTTPAMGKQHSVAKQLFKVVFAIYFIVTLIVTTVQMLQAYRTSEEQVLADLHLRYQTFASDLTQVIASQDPQALRSILGKMAQHPSILGIKVTASDQTLLGGIGTVVNDKGQSVRILEQNREVFERKVMGMFAQDHTLVSTNTENPTLLGKVQLYSNSRIVLLSVRQGYLVLLINAVIKTVALWIIFLVVSRIWLQRAFAQMAYALENLDPANPQSIELDSPTRERNEFKVLEEAFNKLVLKLEKGSKD